VLHLMREHRLAAGDIRRIRLATYKAGLDIIDNARPEGAYQAKFSLQYTVAHAAVHGSVRLNAFLPERLADARVRALMDRIECVADPELSAGYPRQRAARVEIETADGRTLSRFQPYRKGDPELPLTDEELDGKYLELAAPVLGAAPARVLLDQLWRTEKLAHVDFDLGGGAARAAG
jgi:2-methylcitrate dehydratase PrpD